MSESTTESKTESKTESTAESTVESTVADSLTEPATETDQSQTRPAVLDQLLKLLQLERIEHNLFRGQSQDLGWGTLFGGHVLGQALSAAAQTVPTEPRVRSVHSLHSYFLRRGDVSVPVIYDVDRIRDGKSFTTRRVVAIQHGRAIFNLSASFQVNEPGFSHQTTMPVDVPGPEGLPSNRELTMQYMSELPAALRDRYAHERPIEIRPVDPIDPIKPEKKPPRQRLWFRARGPLPDEQHVHQLLLSYASDFNLLHASVAPHGVSYWTRGMQIASLDHAMWFHRPFRMDQWLLYDIDSPSASGARGLARGQFYSTDGSLVASTVQEGLIRQR